MRTAGCSCRCDPGQVFVACLSRAVGAGEDTTDDGASGSGGLGATTPDTQQGTQANSGVEAPTIGLGASPAAGETEPSPALSQPDESFLNGVFLVAGQNYVCELVHARLPVECDPASALDAVNAARTPGSRHALPHLGMVHLNLFWASVWSWPCLCGSLLEPL